MASTEGINPHHRLGNNTKKRMQRALAEALEDYSKAELLATIATYSKLYKARKCDHKYRLVEFLEKRGYEHFLNDKNWNNRGRPQGPMAREDFMYTTPKQDRSFFSFMQD